MAKKKSSFNLGKILYFVAAALGVVAIVMLFVDNVKADLGILGTEEYAGTKVAFGFKEEDTAVFKFSFMGLLPYLLALVGVVLLVVNMLAKKSNKILDYVAVVVFVVSGVLFFCLPNFIACADTILGKIAAEVDYELAVGAIVAAISSIASAAVVLVKTLLKK